MSSVGKTVWKGIRLDEEVVVCIEEALAEGELTTMVTDAITRHGRLAECRRCGNELPQARRLVDRFCDECYAAVSPEVLRRYIDLSIPPGKRPSRSAVDATRYPEWMYDQRRRRRRVRGRRLARNERDPEGAGHGARGATTTVRGDAVRDVAGAS